MSLKNGCDMSWDEWYGSYNSGNNRSISGVGSVLAVRFGTDIGLDSITSAGVAQNNQILVNASFTNINNVPMNVTMYILTQEDGTWNITTSGNITSNVGLLLPSEILKSDVVAIEDNKDVKGGNFWSNVKSFISGIPDKIQKVAPFAKTIYEVGKQLAPLAPLVGLGYDDETGRLTNQVERIGVEGSGGRRRKKKGGVIGGDVGGELVTRSELRERAY
jgi:hypothetical protein